MARKHSVVSIKESTREAGAGTQLVVCNIGAGKRKLNTATSAWGVFLGLTQGDAWEVNSAKDKAFPPQTFLHLLKEKKY